MRSSLFLANLQFLHSITFPALGFWLGGSRSQLDSSSLDFFLIDVITFAAFVKFVFCQIKAKLIPPKVASKKIEETKEGGREARPRSSIVLIEHFEVVTTTRVAIVVRDLVGIYYIAGRPSSSATFSSSSSNDSQMALVTLS